MGPSFSIDITERFEDLSAPPIVEAVFRWWAVTEASSSKELMDRLTAALPDEYAHPKNDHFVKMDMNMSVGGTEARVGPRQWRGLTAKSTDGRNVAQFQRDGFLYSRLAPYEGWEKFKEEALRMWRIYRNVFQPAGVSKRSVRFINRIEPFSISEVSDYLISPPACPGKLDLKLSDFVRQFSFEVPGYPYEAKIFQALQTSAPPHYDESGLIIEIDVSTTKAAPTPNPRLEKDLAEMRYLKDKLFFGCLTKQALVKFRGDDA